MSEPESSGKEGVLNSLPLFRRVQTSDKHYSYFTQAYMVLSSIIAGL